MAKLQEIALKKRLNEIAQLEGKSQAETLHMLCDLYYIKDINKLTELISVQVRQGIDVSRMNQLKVLLSYLKTILDFIQYSDL